MIINGTDAICPCHRGTDKTLLSVLMLIERRPVRVLCARSVVLFCPDGFLNCGGSVQHHRSPDLGVFRHHRAFRQRTPSGSKRSTPEALPPSTPPFLCPCKWPHLPRSCIPAGNPSTSLSSACLHTACELLATPIEARRGESVSQAGFGSMLPLWFVFNPTGKVHLITKITIEALITY